MEAQSLSVKRAEVEFHKFASLGEPERAIAAYAEENTRRAGLIRKHLDFLGSLTPFLEIGANAGHTSYLLANEFGADGFALDISADALRFGTVLQDRWGLERAPVRIAGDALALPFRDGSLSLVVACQMLSQFMDIGSVFREVNRVLAPGGVFFFLDEPMNRALSLRLYRCPYRELMKPWERKLHDWGVLDYLIRDVVGARQEDSFGIRQNHRLGLKDWDTLIAAHFASSEYDLFLRDRGWANRIVKNVAVRLDPYRSVWRAARLLGGSLMAACRKAGSGQAAWNGPSRFEEVLRCPDCASGSLERDAADTLRCACGYRAPNEGGVYNLLATAERRELYPGDRLDILDFSTPGHASGLLSGWYELEGVFGNRYRWIGPRASARLRRVNTGRQRIRLRGHASDRVFSAGEPVTIAVWANGRSLGELTLKRPGLFIFEADVADAPEYLVEIAGRPVWRPPGDDRLLSVTISMLRLVPRLE